MPEYTDLYCVTGETARAVEAYLDEQLYSIEESERPEINARIEKATVRIQYGDAVAREEWDMQLMGFRDGYNAGREVP